MMCQYNKDTVEICLHLSYNHAKPNRRKIKETKKKTNEEFTLKISRSSGAVIPVVVIPVDGCLDAGLISIGFIDITVESTTPPDEGMLFFFSKCQIPFSFSSLFFVDVFFFFLLIYSETKEEEDL